jgi:predicted lipoprotein with Yx(FWY)xxD motif
MSGTGRGNAAWARVAFPVLAAALTATACAGGNYGKEINPGPAAYKAGYQKVPAPPDPTGRSLKLETRTVAGLGTIVTGPSGATVYTFSKDKNHTSYCYGGCSQDWPPVTTVGEPRVGSGLDPSKLGYTERVDSALQVTYKGHPLYFFHEDGREAGETGGEGVTEHGGTWYALAPSGALVKKPPEHGGS